MLADRNDDEGEKNQQTATADCDIGRDVGRRQKSFASSRAKTPSVGFSKWQFGFEEVTAAAEMW